MSGFAVLTSLIYLALQVRQAKRNQQISIRHSRVSRIVELHLALADPDVAHAWLHGVGSPEEITQTELNQFIQLCRALFFHFEDSFYQREEGLLNDDAFETVVAGARLLARSPGVRAAWRLARPNFGGPFLKFMDGVVARSAVEPPVDVSLDSWRIAFASEASRPRTEPSVLGADPTAGDGGARVRGALAHGSAMFVGDHGAKRR